MTHYRLQRIVPVLAMSAALVLSACSEAQSNQKVEKEVVSIPVIAKPVSVGDINATYATTATLEAAEESPVAARVSGVVTKLYVEEGQYVEAGAPLAQLETDKLSLEYKKAQANLKQLANELKRNEKLYTKSLISSEAYERIKYQYESQKAATELAELNLEYATIRAPISGVVANRYIKVGNLLKVNDAAFHLTDMSELHAIIHIPEAEQADLHEGQTAYVQVDAADAPFAGTIDRVSPIVDRDTGTIRVTVSVKDQTGVLRPGMFGRVGVVYDTHEDTLLVPKDSIMTQDDELSVFVVREGVAHKVAVIAGFTNSTHMEVRSGLEADDVVVTTGQRNLKDQSKVELIEQVASL